MTIGRGVESMRNKAVDRHTNGSKLVQLVSNDTNECANSGVTCTVISMLRDVVE